MSIVRGCLSGPFFFWDIRPIRGKGTMAILSKRAQLLINAALSGQTKSSTWPIGRRRRRFSLKVLADGHGGRTQDNPFPALPPRGAGTPDQTARLRNLSGEIRESGVV